MKVLHLFSNTKWTGPAEPALSLCVSLKALGVEIDFACGRARRGAKNKILETAKDWGIATFEDFHLSKHRRPVANYLDGRALTRVLEENRHDLVHCHLDNDHRIAAGPAWRMGIPLVRSSYHGAGFTPEGTGGRAAAYAKLLSRTRFLIEASKLARDRDVDLYRFPHGYTRVIPGAVDTGRFDPGRALPDGRRTLGIPEQAFVVGIVARMQTHRRFEDFWEAMARLVKEDDRLHVIVIGRGTQQEAVGKGPVQSLGLEERVHFPGYVTDDAYAGMLNAFDVKVFLVPGSDGTCRAVREAMALGKPAVVARRGMLPEIVDHGKDGFVFDGSVEGLVDALRPLMSDPALTRQLGEAALEKARSQFSLPAQAKAVIEVYESILC